MRKRKVGCLAILLMALAACCTAPVLLMSAAAARQSTGQDQVDAAAAGIPERMLAAYLTGASRATTYSPDCKGMRWQILAGIARVESDHAAGHQIADSGDITPPITGPRLDGSGAGGNTTAIPDTDHGKWDGDTAYDRAVGPFQFLPETFRTYGRDGNGDGAISPHNADDAALAAAIYLCGDGRDLTNREQLRAAIHTYNLSWAYVDDVTSGIYRYDALGNTPSTATGTAGTVIQAALAQTGIPYSWGGGGPEGPSTGVCCSPGGQDGRTVTGFDCSGLTQYAYAQAGINLPRTAAEQAGAGRRIPASAGFGALQPGDLIFYGYSPTADSTIHHVGIYLGDGQMINAPRPGRPVSIDPVNAMPDYAGGTRLL
ncbi:NlpC/P60 family protein [Streptomyces sp. NBC_00536]|uniref:C40 family peptidase n=1 Tax=Streptomyces sp. NBC_00536 TaxID=2975769 RepID=UPI002E801CB8|nr:C40 family peptidase [Streptomyces sp. NBC_00536]WUC83453.1 NlpC/P60 family protein [Streptomyces sp. NBC_00536]